MKCFNYVGDKVIFDKLEALGMVATVLNDEVPVEKFIDRCLVQ